MTTATPPTPRAARPGPPGVDPCQMSGRAASSQTAPRTTPGPKWYSTPQPAPLENASLATRAAHPAQSGPSRRTRSPRSSSHPPTTPTASGNHA